MGQPFTFASDVWALGLTALELAEGYLPHSKLSASRVTKAIVNGNPPTLKLPFWSSKFRHFVRMCLLKDPNHRPVTGDLLSHPFILSAPGPECIKPLLVRLRYLPKNGPVLGSAAILRYHVASADQDKPSHEHSFTSTSISEHDTSVPSLSLSNQHNTRWATPDAVLSAKRLSPIKAAKPDPPDPYNTSPSKDPSSPPERNPPGKQ
jgi:serine/threonine protein kinase